MATDPRNQTRFDENDYHGQTYAFDDSIDGPTLGSMGATPSPSTGLAVCIVDDGTVGLGSEDDPVVGKLKKVSDDGFCTVQDEGYMKVPITATGADEPAAGDFVAADGAGGVKVSATFLGARCVQVVGGVVTIKI